jgi:hypothetical protein
MALEVEQKFYTNPNDNNNNNNETICSKLESMGFVEKGPTKTMTDWYFDVPNNLTLSLNDCWLRYREVGAKKGKWQLKQGQQDRTLSTNSATVYKEVEGIEAVEIALSILSQGADSSLDPIEGLAQGQLFDGHQIPTMPISNHAKVHLLTPYVRLVTKRSSWVLSSKEYNPIQVDLDTTNTYYAVGEVEMVIDDEADLQEAKRKIQEVIDKLQEGQNEQEQGPPLGKLEHFLQTQRYDHYQALIQSGILNRR